MPTWTLMAPDNTPTTLDGLGIRLRHIPGAGMPPLHHQTTETTTTAASSATTWQGCTPTPRRLVLELTPRVRQTHLPTIRRTLLAILNPDLVTPETPARLRCSGAGPNADRTVEIPIVYVSGLSDIGETDQLNIELLSFDPIWTATQPTDPITISVSTDLTLSRVMHRSVATDSVGTWHALGSLESGVAALIHTSTGMLIAGGSFQTPLAVAQWNSDLAQWEALGTGLPSVPDSHIYALALAPDGTLYVGGALTGSVQQYASGVWSSLALTDSTSTWVYALAVGTDGCLYAGGELHGAINSVPLTSHIAVWDGAVWTEIAGVNDIVYALAVGLDGRIYAGGLFTTPGGSHGHVAVWDGTAWAALGQGLDGPVYHMLCAADGLIYAAGAFTGGVAVWNGIVWRVLGSPGLAVSDDSGGTLAIYTLAIGQDGTLYAGGHVDRADTLHLPHRMAQWNGSVWFPLDGDFPSSDIQALLVDSSGNLTVGYSGAGTARVGAVTRLTNNGSAAAWPVWTCHGPGRLFELHNWSTGDIIYIDIDLLPGETLTIDLRPGSKSVSSSFRGNVMGLVVPGSNLARWRLIPGDNLVSLLMLADSGTPSATVYWHQREWSV